MPGRHIKGVNLGSRQSCERVEAGKGAAGSSDRGARRIGLANSQCQEDARCCSAPGGDQKNQARGYDSRGQKAIVTGDEKAVGRAEKERFVTASASQTPADGTMRGDS